MCGTRALYGRVWAESGLYVGCVLSRGGVRTTKDLCVRGFKAGRRLLGKRLQGRTTKDLRVRGFKAGGRLLGGRLQGRRETAERAAAGAHKRAPP
eukprot:271366-Chlamydomonas_euryale.AAC.1